MHVVAKSQARQRMPAVTVLERRDRGEQFLESEMLHDREVQLADLDGIAVGDLGGVDDVE